MRVRGVYINSIQSVAREHDITFVGCHVRMNGLCRRLWCIVYGRWSIWSHESCKCSESEPINKLLFASSPVYRATPAPTHENIDRKLGPKGLVHLHLVCCK